MWVHVTSIWALFCMFLSLRVLRVVSVPLYVVVRNCGPAATALLNFLIRQEGLSPQRVCGVLLLVVGAALFSLGDQVSGGQSTEESQGLEQAVGLTVSIALAAVLEMMALERLKKNGLDLRGWKKKTDELYYLVIRRAWSRFIFSVSGCLVDK
eukprot:g19295.t1